jgi:hypothetical protein
MIKSEEDGLLADVTVVVPPSMQKATKSVRGKPYFDAAEFDVQDKELVRLDPRQRFELSRQWDSRLQRPLASAHHGLLIALLLAPPVWAVWRWLRWQAAVRRGQCAHCGYDLRGSSQRCPECGTPILYPKAASSAPA